VQQSGSTWHQASRGGPKTAGMSSARGAREQGAATRAVMRPQVPCAGVHHVRGHAAGSYALDPSAEARRCCRRRPASSSVAARPARPRRTEAGSSEAGSDVVTRSSSRRKARRGKRRSEGPAPVCTASEHGPASELLEPSGPEHLRDPCSAVTGRAERGGNTRGHDLGRSDEGSASRSGRSRQSLRTVRWTSERRGRRARSATSRRGCRRRRG